MMNHAVSFVALVSALGFGEAFHLQRSGWSVARVGSTQLGAGSSSPLDGEPRRDFVKRVVGTAAGLGLVGGSFGQPALADVTVDANAIKYTKGGAKYVVAKEGGCPLSDKLGVLGSCAPKTGTKNRLPTHGCIEFNM